jgi:hypothetical protein
MDKQKKKKVESEYTNGFRDEGDKPTVAPSMEMDELEVDASSEDIKEGDSTSVTKLVIDRYD